MDKKFLTLFQNRINKNYTIACTYFTNRNYIQDLNKTKTATVKKKPLIKGRSSQGMKSNIFLQIHI